MIHEITITKQKSAFYRTITNFESEYIKKTNRAYLLKTFETILNKPCDWEDITDVFLLEFKNTLLNNLCSNSCRTIFAELRSLLKTFSFFREIPAKQYEVTLKCKKEGTLNIYLTNNEIKKILDFTPKLKNEILARAIFLKSVYTGARFEDAKILNINNLDKNTNTLVFVPDKTKSSGAVVKVPFHKNLIDVINIDTTHDIFLHAYNRALRNICKKVGIDSVVNVLKAGKRLRGNKYEFVSSHTARRSFATNLYLAGAEIDIIRSFMGHASTMQTQKYILAEKELNANVLKFFS